ncbi:hypothetical protein JHK85_000752 [Glycine max]|nr:hypothetical protein JHK85_000752 [Glycine max]
MKFPSEQGSMITIHANQKVTRECYMASLKLIPILESQVVNMVTMANMDDVSLPSTPTRPRIHLYSLYKVSFPSTPP